MLNTLVAILALTCYTNAHGCIIDIRGANGKINDGFRMGAASLRPGGRGATSVIGEAFIGCGQ
ncbi:hypothetical protein FRC07_000464 [Ceratobasidium sp. 392]|nr:hypothetical protein FRC07_000464 [Ceratobasidium sp. 392]